MDNVCETTYRGSWARITVRLPCFLPAKQGARRPRPHTPTRRRLSAPPPHCPRARTPSVRGSGFLPVGGKGTAAPRLGGERKLQFPASPVRLRGWERRAAGPAPWEERTRGAGLGGGGRVKPSQ